MARTCCGQEHPGTRARRAAALGGGELRLFVRWVLASAGDPLRERNARVRPRGGARARPARTPPVIPRASSSSSSSYSPLVLLQR